MIESKQLKVVLVGEARVGKTSIINRYIRNPFQEHGTPTLGAAYYTRTLEVNKQLLKLNIWDTAGQERYHSLAKLYSRDANIIIFVYDITEKKSFEALISWHKKLENDGISPSTVFGVFANKEDLVEHEEVPLEEARKFSARINAFFAKTSAKSDLGIEDSFLELSKRFFRKSIDFEKNSFKLDSIQFQHKPKKKRCCR